MIGIDWNLLEDYSEADGDDESRGMPRSGSLVLKYEVEEYDGIARSGRSKHIGYYGIESFIL